MPNSILLGMHPRTNANVLGANHQGLQGNKSISMVNSGSKDKRVLKMTICKKSDSEDVQRIIAFAYLLINPLVVFMCKGQDHCVMISNQSGVRFPQTAVFFVLNILLLSTDTLFLHRFPVSLVSVNRGETEDILEMVWPFFGSWWPSWSECSMSLSSRFFQLSDSQALFITPQDQQLLTDSLSVMHPCWVSLQSTTMCFANAIYKEWIQERERVQWKEFRAFQVPSHRGIF